MAHVDIHSLRREANHIADLFTQAKTLRVTSGSGTDLTVDLSGLEGNPEDGFLWDPAKKGFKTTYAILPPAQPGVWLPPGRCQGTLAVDAHLDPEARIHDRRDQPAVLTIGGGRIVKVEGIGEKVSRFREWLDTRTSDETSRTGPVHCIIGTNPQARLLSEHIESGRVLGAITWGWGDSSIMFQMGGTDIDAVTAPLHWDTMLVDPAGKLDDRLIVQDGVIIEEAL
jgi:leucyl aminopeptidase (aminopeptidase T)